MQPLHDFLQRNFIWLFFFCFVWVFISFGWRFYRHKRTAVVFPHVPPERIRFEERTASGCSHKSIFTRLAGTRNCLHITVSASDRRPSSCVKPSFQHETFSSARPHDCQFNRPTSMLCAAGHDWANHRKGSLAGALAMERSERSIDYEERRSMDHTVGKNRPERNARLRRNHCVSEET